MKKVIIAVTIFMLMAGTVEAFKNQPLGWQGWAWGTKLNEVAGWLNFDSKMEDEKFTVSIDVFSRQGETKTHLGTRWNSVGYGFINGQLEGIMLLADGEVNAFAALISLQMEYGETEADYSWKEGDKFQFWEGEYGNIFSLYQPKDDEYAAMTMVCIGTKRFMDAIAATVFQLSTMNEALTFFKVISLLDTP